VKRRAVLSIFASAAVFIVCRAEADPLLPVIASNTFTVAPATGNATTDTANLKAALTALKTTGGTVIVPAGTYLSNQLALTSGINLQLSAGAIIRDNSTATLITTTGSNLHDIEISGSGTIDGHGTTATSSNNLVDLRKINKLLISGVTIENATHEHLVTENDTNLTINGININDAGTLAANKNAYLANTDGIDYSGQHVLIENSNISDGDDDIVAKPTSGAFCSDITITNDAIGAGHGISVGGQTDAGLDGLTVSHITFNGTDNGLRMKAGASTLMEAGGVVKNVSFSNITMTNVTNPIIINSWYDGGDHYGTNELSAGSLDNPSMFNAANPGDPLVTVNESSNAALYPFYDNVTYSDITATGGSGNVAIIYGLNSTDANPLDPMRNIDNILFNNVNLSGAFGADIYYTSNLNISGLSVTARSGSKENLFGDTVVVPEPSGIVIMSTLLLGYASCRRRNGVRVAL
jgi:polygalacturonase